LEPANVIAAVRNEGTARSKTPPSDDRIRELLDAAASSVLQDVRTTFITDAQNYFIRHQLEEQNIRERATQAALEYLDQCNNLDAKLSILPGFKIYGQFVERLQSESGITLRFESLIETLEPDTAPSELREVLSKIENLTPAANTTSVRS